MDFNNYDFNADVEIPLDVLRERFITHPLKRSGSTTVNRATAGAIPDKAKRVIDGLILVATLFICFVAVFGMVTINGTEPVPGYDFIYFGEYNLVDTTIDMFSYIFDDVSTLFGFVNAVIAISLTLSFVFSVIAFFIDAVFTIFSSISSFIKKQSLALERHLINLIKKGMSVYLFASLTNSGYSIIGWYQINTTLTLSFVLASLLIVGVAITRNVIRKRRGASSDEFLKLHITSFIANFAIFAIITSRAMFTFISVTIMRFVTFVGNIPASLDDGQYIVTAVVGVAFFVMGAILVSNLQKALYRDSLRLITSGEGLDAKTKSELLNEDFNKKPFKKYAIFGAIAFGVAVINAGRLLISEALVEYRNMYLFIALISLTATILTEIFKKAKKK